MRVRIAELRDDLDGSKADETVVFAIDGNRYQIDLSKRNATKFRAAVKPYIEGAVISQYRRAMDRHLDVEVPRVEAAVVRRWANAMQPGTVAVRGRIPKAVYLAYNLAHAETPAPVEEHIEEGAS